MNLFTFMLRKQNWDYRRLGGDANDDEKKKKLEGGHGYWFS